MWVRVCKFRFDSLTIIGALAAYFRLSVRLLRFNVPFAFKPLPPL